MLCTLPETCDLGMLIQTSNRWKLSAWGQGAWPRGRGTPAGTGHPSSACIPHLLLSARSLRAKHHISGSVTRTGGSATSAILCNGIAASNQVRRNNIKCPTSWTILNRIILFFFFLPNEVLLFVVLLVLVARYLPLYLLVALAGYNVIPALSNLWSKQAK